MKKQIYFSLSGIFLLLLVQTSMFAQNGTAYPQDKKLPKVIIYSSGKIENFKIEANNRSKSGELPTATFEVTYNGFSEQAKAAFAEAVRLWSYLVSSNVPIKIDAYWKPLGTNVLGSAGAASYRRGFINAPMDAAWYPIAIANKLAGYDIEPDAPDIEANFSSTFDWYLGTDGNCPSLKYDFISVVMHEIGHGLGFVGSAYVDASTGLGSWGSNTNIPFIYDVFVYNGFDKQLINTKLFTNPSRKLKAEYTSESIFFKSELGNAASPSGVVPLYAPKIWNSGSSYSHLGEYFNGGANSMMTYSVGSGEVTHDPGPVTLAMFAEMGWKNVSFKHTQVKDIETMNESLVIETEIYSDDSINNESVLLHYSTDKFVTDNIVNFTTANDTLYTASIPALVADTVQYYFEATTKSKRTYYHPTQGVMPVTTINKTLFFCIGADITPPVITHQNSMNTFNFEKELKLTFGANDNLGLDSVYVEYKVNNSEIIELSSQAKGYSEIDNLYLFESSINIENLNDLDTIYYRIIAKDASQSANTKVLPDNNMYKTVVHVFGEPVTRKTITFDVAEDNNVIIDNGLSVWKPTGFTSIGLHSPHPYLEGDPFPSDQIEYSAILKTPVILNETDSYLRFNEIVIVEPGDPGAVFGDAEFWDYVIVEGSVDSAQTWFYFEDGYDCNIATVFKNAFANGTNGTESMYREHKTNLLNNNFVGPKDTVLIRFRLYSDQASAGWGWAIDNIEIQPDITAITNNEIASSNLLVFPNPSNGDFEIKVSDEDKIGDYKVVVYNALGKEVFIEANQTSSNTINRKVNLSQMPEGVYLICINFNSKTISEKIMIK